MHQICKKQVFSLSVYKLIIFSPRCHQYGFQIYYWCKSYVINFTWPVALLTKTWCSHTSSHAEEGSLYLPEGLHAKSGCSSVSPIHTQTLIFVWKVGRIKHSKVWPHFADGACCHKCSRTFSCKGRNTNSLSKHLVKIHHIQARGFSWRLVMWSLPIQPTRATLGKHVTHCNGRQTTSILILTGASTHRRYGGK